MNPTDQPALDLDAIEAAIAAYQHHPNLGFACCSAHPVADSGAALAAEVRRLRAELASLTTAARAAVAADVHRAELPTFPADETPEVVARTVRAIDVRLAGHGVDAPYYRPATPA